MNSLLRHNQIMHKETISILYGTHCTILINDVTVYQHLYE